MSFIVTYYKNLLEKIYVNMKYLFCVEITLLCVKKEDCLWQQSLIQLNNFMYSIKLCKYNLWDKSALLYNVL